MVRVENLTKSFGSHILFDAVSFKLNPRERLGLVGRNGHGKTTLFRLLVGEEVPDSGSIAIPRQYRIGYVRQNIAFTRGSVLEEGATGLPQQEKGDYWKVEKILAGLGFSNKDMQRHPAEFSGGYQVRLNLAKVLVSDPDLLLLDEPTNYLDIAAIRWIERYLVSWPHELMLITHDRSFMDKIVTHTLGIHRRKLRKIKGKTEKYYAQVAQDEEIYEKTRIKDERRRKEIKQFISRFRAKARLANLVQSRIKTLTKMVEHEKLEKIKTLDFSFRNQPFPGKHVLNARNICFAYDLKHPLIQDLDITIGAQDRICVVGKNGKGKTTLLKLLAGVLKPQKGEITYNPNVTFGLFEQTHIQFLVDSRTIEEEILYSNSQVDRQLARNICGAMMFEGDDPLKKIAVLSGGEKSRVMLGKLLATPVNLLLLDEPTNHLDMDSSDALLAAIDNFEGTLILVTHNEMFLHALAKRLVVFQKDRIEVFEGSYQRFLEKGGWEDEFIIAESSDRKIADHTENQVKLNKKEIRRLRSEIVLERGKVLKPIKEQIDRIENEIETYENVLHKLHEEMQAATLAQDGKRIAELSQAIHSNQSSIDKLFDELESIGHTYEIEKIGFENKLRQLEDDLK
jgi:ATP-binding cassette subfamily F protein 3